MQKRSFLYAIALLFLFSNASAKAQSFDTTEVKEFFINTMSFVINDNSELHYNMWSEDVKIHYSAEFENLKEKLNFMPEWSSNRLFELMSKVNLYMRREIYQSEELTKEQINEAEKNLDLNFEELKQNIKVTRVGYLSTLHIMKNDLIYFSLDLNNWKIKRDYMTITLDAIFNAARER